MARDLTVYLQGEVVGTLRQEDSGRLTFSYRGEWLRQAGRRPLSLSLPLQGAAFEDRVARPFFAGLLPDDLSRERLARHLGVSRHNDFALLAEVGGECAGAIAFYPPDVPPPAAGAGDLAPLDEAALAALLRDLPRRPLHAGGELRLSLAGAQDKMALVHSDETFFLPRGDFPTTHILKPAITQFVDTVPNECFCMKLAARVGIRVPAVEMASAEDVQFLLIERYDRAPAEDGLIQRVHQEDFCQALAIPPERKYQGEGGPSLARSFALLEACSRPALDRLEMLRRVLFNYLIGNADAHGKNFALLHEAEGTRLAPAYDLLCTTVYRDHTGRMAMKVGGRNRFGQILPRHWERFARDVGLAPPRVRRDLLAMAERLPAEARRLAEEIAPSPPDPARSMFEQITHDISERAEATRRAFRTVPGVS
ncbi:MAG: type II toxin-antitoxin system HipA family toxin [bacterium]|nr:type II toxin-antitoxin system HipA family toxin [bacterium]